jgi:hypothetical protein
MTQLLIILNMCPASRRLLCAPPPSTPHQLGSNRHPACPCPLSSAIQDSICRVRIAPRPCHPLFAHKHPKSFLFTFFVTRFCQRRHSEAVHAQRTDFPFFFFLLQQFNEIHTSHTARAIVLLKHMPEKRMKMQWPPTLLPQFYSVATAGCKNGRTWMKGDTVNFGAVPRQSRNTSRVSAVS